MPEGPEIRLAADRVARVLVGQRIDDAWLAFPRLEHFEDALIGSTVTGVDTRGKAMLTRFDNDLTLYSHNQLYGRWYTCRRDQPPTTKRSLRVALHTATHSALLYSASDVDVLDRDGLHAHPFLNRVGPDILDHSLTTDSVARRLEDAAFRNRRLGGLYLDQSFLAGVGNYLRSEILHVAGVHPADKPAALERPALRRLAKETLAVSRRSYRTRGITVTKALERRLRGQGLTRSRYRFWAFGRDGLPCHRCGTDIVRMDVAGRGFFYCPVCQRRG